MQQLSSPKEMRDWSRAERARGRRIGFVPTMGFLHQGHLQLVDRAKQRADRVVMSIFVNPLQFSPAEDLAQYPRDLERDRTLAAERGVGCLFVPDTAAMYPTEPLVRISPGPMADTLEGAARPGHFAGVLTVVAKLFHIVEPDIAVFGRKDFHHAPYQHRLLEILPPEHRDVRLHDVEQLRDDRQHAGEMPGPGGALECLRHRTGADAHQRLRGVHQPRSDGGDTRG